MAAANPRRSRPDGSSTTEEKSAIVRTGNGRKELVVDIAGAKALKERLGSKAAYKTPLASVDIPEEAPPLFHWTGIPGWPSEASSAESDPEADLGTGGRVSRFRRLRFSLR
jgi:hypothetical protein